MKAEIVVFGKQRNYFSSQTSERNTFYKPSISFYNYHFGQKVKYQVWNLVDRYSEINPLLRSSAYILRSLHKILLKIMYSRLNNSELFSSSWLKIKYYDNQIKVGIAVDEINRARLT